MQMLRGNIHQQNRAAHQSLQIEKQKRKKHPRRSRENNNHRIAGSAPADMVRARCACLYVL